jgi:hypothetical protein
MKNNLIIIFFFFFQFCQSQSLENDWGKFYCENWKVKIQSDKTIFLGKVIEYEVSFYNEKGNSRDVNYYVYKKSDIDVKFNIEVEKYLMMQSCLFERGEFNFNSFYLNGYYYFLVPCHCSTKKNKECENLAQKIESYITEK